MKRIMMFAALLVCVTAMTALAGSYNYVGQEQFKEWLEKGKDMTIVDIQVPTEFSQHHFKGALETGAYPVKSATDKQKLDTVLPQLATTGKHVVVICPRGGGGAKNTSDYLKEKGIDENRIFILKEGMQGWPYKELAVTGK
jgi:rhodanese-related sulfurtransferase